MLAPMADLTPDYHRRDCSLPLGCKDLLEVLKLPPEKPPAAAMLTPAALPEGHGIAAKPKTIEIPDEVTVKKLAALLGCKPYEVVAALISLKIFAPNDDYLLLFEVAARVAALHVYDVNRGNE